jgi:hypothetical protein
MLYTSPVDPQTLANATRPRLGPTIHHHWDHRARGDIADGDTLLFASGDPDRPSMFSFDDSNQPDDPAAKERLRMR